MRFKGKGLMQAALLMWIREEGFHDGTRKSSRTGGDMNQRLAALTSID
jgi:hypothetical protein